MSKRTTGGGFDPLADISWDVYFNASLITGLSNNEPVAIWEDSSANGNNAFQGNASLRGLYKTSIINGEPVVNFTGDGYNLTTFFYRTSGWTAFHVIKKPASTNVLPCLASNLGSPYSFFPYSDGSVYASSRSEFEWLVDGATGFAVWTANCDSSGNISIYKNGVLQSTVDGQPSSVSNFRYLGYRQLDSSFATGDMAHISCADSPLGTSDRQAMEKYLGNLYNIPITH